MRRAILLGLAAALIIPSTAIAAGGPNDRRYVVVLRDSVAAPAEVAAAHARGVGLSVGHVYRHTIKGYSAVLSPARLARLRADSRVDYIVADELAHAVHHRPNHSGGPGGGGSDPDPSCPGQQVLPWGIDRIDGDLSSTAAGNCSGAVANVNVYVIDTGVDPGHADLNVVRFVNFAGGPSTDCNGHGTHVAGTMSARDNTQDVVGVAPGSPITAVKVLNCNGSGWISDVIRGVDWVTANAQRPAVANMSLGGSRYQPLDDAVKASANAGVTYSVAAGNNGANACNYSPAAAGTHGGVITTAATNSSDAETSWSNYGPCVDLWAPGASILSTRAGGGTTTLSGTSMAAPHVGGGAALYLSSHTGASASAVENALRNAAQTLSTRSKDNSSIRLVYVRTF